MNTKAKKETKSKSAKPTAETSELRTKEELKAYLLNIRDRMQDDGMAAIYALSALNHALTSSDIYKTLDNENKEIARDVWLRIRQGGMQIKNPPLLFADGA